MVKRLKKEQVENIFRLTKKGISLNRIEKITGLKKTTIYYHFRKIKPKTTQPIIVNSENDELIGEVVGLFAGDGSCDIMKKGKYRVRLHFNITEKEFVRKLNEDVLKNIFGKEPMVFRQENRLNLCYYSKNIHLLLNTYLTWDKSRRKTYSVQLKTHNHPLAFCKGFIRGSLDSDGCLSDKKISFATVSPGLKDNISFFLEQLDIKHSVRKYKEKRSNRKDIYHINVMRKEHGRFMDIIKPRNIKGLNAPAEI